MDQLRLPKSANPMAIKSLKMAFIIIPGSEISKPPMPWISQISTVVTLTSQLIKPQENDGALPLCSGRYGQIIGQDYKHNHFDEVNHFFGMIDVFA